MKYLMAIVLTVCLWSTAIAQQDTSQVSLPTSGEVRSDMPAATTGTAPIDTGVPSGTGTTGTSGTTMAQAERNNESNTSFIWVLVGAMVLAGLIVVLRKQRKAT